MSNEKLEGQNTHNNVLTSKGSKVFKRRNKVKVAIGAASAAVGIGGGIGISYPIFHEATPVALNSINFGDYKASMNASESQTFSNVTSTTGGEVTLKASGNGEDTNWSFENNVLSYSAAFSSKTTITITANDGITTSSIKIDLLPETPSPTPTTYIQAHCVGSLQAGENDSTIVEVISVGVTLPTTGSSGISGLPADITGEWQSTGDILLTNNYHQTAETIEFTISVEDVSTTTSVTISSTSEVPEAATDWTPMDFPVDWVTSDWKWYPAEYSNEINGVYKNDEIGSEECELTIWPDEQDTGIQFDTKSYNSQLIEHDLRDYLYDNKDSQTYVSTQTFYLENYIHINEDFEIPIYSYDGEEESDVSAIFTVDTQRIELKINDEEQGATKTYLIYENGLPCYATGDYSDKETLWINPKHILLPNNPDYEIIFINSPTNTTAQIYMVPTSGYTTQIQKVFFNPAQELPDHDNAKLGAYFYGVYSGGDILMYTNERESEENESTSYLLVKNIEQAHHMWELMYGTFAQQVEMYKEYILEYMADALAEGKYFKYLEYYQYYCYFDAQIRAINDLYNGFQASFGTTSIKFVICNQYDELYQKIIDLSSES